MSIAHEKFSIQRRYGATPAQTFAAFGDPKLRRQWFANAGDWADFEFYGRVVHRWDEQALTGLTAYFRRLMDRPAVSRVVDEAREYRAVFPLPWPDHVD